MEWDNISWTIERWFCKKKMEWSIKLALMEWWFIKLAFRKEYKRASYKALIFNERSIINVFF